MKEARRSISSGTAIAVGMIAVNLPVFALLLGPGYVLSLLGHDDWLLWAVPASFIAAWTWWSFSVPRWRLWAYERVDSTSDVHAKAVQAGLVWPRGSFFERTEITSRAQRERQAELERRAP